MTVRTRDYSVVFQNIAVNAVQDLFAIYGTSSAGGIFQGFELGQVTSTGIIMARYSIRRLPATVTPGSGGASATPRPMLSGDAAATVTARTNDTAQASTSGTLQTLHGSDWNLVNGTGLVWFYNSNMTFKAGEAISISLDTTLTAITLSGTLYFGEPY